MRWSLFSGMLLLVIWPCLAQAQIASNARQKWIKTQSDSVVVDTLSVVPGSLRIYSGASLLPDSLFRLKPEAAILFLNRRNAQLPDSVLIVYRVFPMLLSQTFRNRDRSIIERNYAGSYNPFSYENSAAAPGFFKLEGLQRNGNISRGVNFGNNQDVVVNSSFNLQLSGKLNDDVEILAAITDNNIPVQPEGNTQQIQDFDKVFIQLSKNKSKLIAGDFELRRPESWFMNFYKKGQGALFTTAYEPFADSSKHMRTTVSGAISKGKYARNIIAGTEANQGPYRLAGSENETFIVVLSGTEKVFVDGMEMVRGEQNDYVIDYNTAEITFTTRRPITKDKRIVVEFQYSDKNYSRTMLFANQEYQDRKWKVKANIFSEQDAKNQPLLQDLDNDAKALLASVGDSIQNAFFPNIDSVGFNTTEVLYALRDSAGYSFYEYSTDSTKAFYRLGFSLVGAGKGNYVQVAASANGRVFRWIPPVNNVLQGSYEPVILLVSPKKQQMVTLGADYQINSKTAVTFESAWSRYDVNLFSARQKKDDDGYAFRGGLTKGFNLSADTIRGWKGALAVNFEHVSTNFKAIESFRPVEFNRDWNLGNSLVADDENAADLKLTFRNTDQMLSYQVKTFVKGSDYKGIMNVLSTGVSFLKLRLATSTSYLISESPVTNSGFFRSVADLSRAFRYFIGGVRLEQEQNKLINASNDSLLPSAFMFDSRKLYLVSADTAAIGFKLDYTRRYDYAAKNNEFFKSTMSDDVSSRVDLRTGSSGRLSLTSSYRNLQIRDSLLSTLQPEESILNRIEYNGMAFKGFFTFSTYFEAGTGQELKKEYAFVEVAPGTGIYTYAGDYNNNGVKDLDEFEVAVFADQANFVKVFLPTNEYIKTRTNQFNQVLTITPAAWFTPGKKGIDFLNRFSNQTSYRVDNKTLEKDLLRALNPFESNIDDSILISTNAAFRNTLSFNRNSAVFGWDATWQSNSGKSVLTNGFESRVLSSLVNNLRWNINRTYSLLLTTENGVKKSTSEFFSNRDYDLGFYKIEPRFSIQPGLSFRSTISYEFMKKENTAVGGGQLSEQHNAGLELKYSSVKKGVATAKFNVIAISYNDEENTPIAYEILEGLKKGTNYTWGFSLQRSLSNSIQLNLNYEGRKPEGTKVIHTGGVQARAFF